VVNGPIIWRIVICGAQPPFKKKKKKKEKG
jgi:hypothetical protein